jgi:TRAP-type C4-dicarboxylate transport system permease large subunit
VAWFKGGLDRNTLKDCLYKTAVSSAMIFFIILGAGVYNTFLAFSQLPQSSAAWVLEQGFSPWTILIIVLALYVILGCIMDSMSMILLTVPIFFPIVSVMDFGLPPEEFALWFGILILVVAEIGLITPPVGLNLFIINSMAKDIPIRDTFIGIMPFISADLLRTVLLVLFPAISLWLVRLLY